MGKFKDFLHRIHHKNQIVSHEKRVAKQFVQHTEKLDNLNDRVARADYQLTVAVHTIEKGLGCKRIKPKFGEDKALRICNLLLEYQKKEYPQDKYGYLEGCAIIKAYIEYKDSVNENIPIIKEKYREIIKNSRADLKQNSYIAGKDVFNKTDVECHNPEIIKEFLSRCHSTRNYKEEPVKEQDIIDSIKLANCAPSACNRQPVNCYYVMDENKIAMVDEIIPGNNAIKGQTPNYIIVTCTMSHFSVKEYNQWYVNGGIYLGYLREALCINNIGNCIYQWGIDADEKTMRQIYNIPDREVIIAAVGIGYYDEKIHCIKAQRK